MWNKIRHNFDKYPARMNVARKIVELGLRVDLSGKIYCENVEISDVALARAVNVDRRTIKATVEVILRDDQLSNIFENIMPAGALLKKVAKDLELGVVEIEANAESPGILAQATQLISSNNISIRQAHASDPELEETPRLTIITQNPIPGILLSKFLDIKGVKRVSIY
ncbi:amino acid-binding protein [Methanobacterium alcaliphilum]|uniref:amino acid-binding protein n=1 Tax=Methanobacterium alcaliphilum TaxID=392018 RepID=UPI00200A9D22|nr:amino acid-binding protein [Methanobacterium alcaliphilum]MCK9152602.1 amino acid-binding protein [Methanobacterium alcaliphilum]